jgi:hypothetical protein
MIFSAQITTALVLDMIVTENKRDRQTERERERD